MNTLTMTYRVLFLLLIGLALMAGGAGAATFTYNFHSLNIGAIAGQDGWSPNGSTWTNAVVANGPGAGNANRVLSGFSSGGAGVGARRYLSHPFVFDSANPSGSIRFWAFAGGPNADQVWGNLEINGTTLPQFGIYYTNGAAGPCTFIRPTTYVYGAALTKSNWYELKLDVDFSVAGGKGSLSYRNVTTGQTGFTADPALQNVPLSALQNPEGRYLCSAFQFRMGANVDGATFCADNFSVTGSMLPGLYTALSDPFTDGAFTNGADPFDITWTNENAVALSVANDAVINKGNALKVNVPPAASGACFGTLPLAAVLGAEIGCRVRLSFDARLDNSVSDATGFRFGLYQCAYVPASYSSSMPTNTHDSGYFAIISTGSSNGVNILSEPNTSDTSICGGPGSISLAGVGTDVAASLANTTTPHEIQLDLVRTTTGESGAIRVTLMVDGVVRCVRDDATPLVRAFDLVVFRGQANNLDFTLDNVTLTSVNLGRGSVYAIR